MTKFKLTATIPVVQYGNIMPEYEFEAETFEQAQELVFAQLEKDWNRFGEKPFPKKEVQVEGYEIRQTFTGETIKYDPVAHTYLSMEGKTLLSGSAYKHMFDKPFPEELMAGKVAAKNGLTIDDVKAMWKGNSKISTTLGTALHLAMEQWFKYRDKGCGDKEYNLAKHPFLRTAILEFPLRDELVYPEIMVSHVESGMVGQIDLLHVLNLEQRIARVEDYKSDAKILEKKENLPGHFKQLSYYSKILMKWGWSIEGIDVWNYTDKWERYESPVLELEPINGTI